MAGFSNRSIAKQILGNGGFGAVGQVTSFLGVIAYTQLMPQSILGSYFLLVAVLLITTSVCCNGVSNDITRRISKSATPGKELTIAGVFTVGVTVFTVILAVLIEPVLSAYIGNGFAGWLAILLPITIFAQLVQSVLEGEQKNTRVAALVTTKRIGMYTVGSGGVLSGFEPSIALVGGLIFGNILIIGSGITMIDVSPTGRPTVKELRQLLYRAANLTVVSLGNLGQEWVDTLLIGVFLTPDAVALYEVAWRLSAIGLLVTNPIVSVLYPRFAEAVEAKNHNEIPAYVQKALLYLSASMIALFAGAVALGPELVTVLYGGSYASAYVPLLVLLAGRLPYSFARITTVVSFSYDRDRGVTRASVVAGLFNAIINVFVIPLIGIVGAAVGSLLSFTVLAFLLFWQVADDVHYPSAPQLGSIIIAAGVMLIMVRLISNRLPATLPSLLGLVALGGTLFAALFVLLNSSVKSDMSTLLDVIR
jgi:O-antigen/teichoic acid export membrane protein